MKAMLKIAQRMKFVETVKYRIRNKWNNIVIVETNSVVFEIVKQNLLNTFEEGTVIIQFDKEIRNSIDEIQLERMIMEQKVKGKALIIQTNDYDKLPMGLFLQADWLLKIYHNEELNYTQMNCAIRVLYNSGKESAFFEIDSLAL